MKIRSLALVLAAAACGHRYDAEEDVPDADVAEAVDASSESTAPEPIPSEAGIPADAAPTARACDVVGVPPPGVDTLCVDFDGPDVGTGWTKTTPDGGGPKTIDTVYASAPNCLYDKSAGNERLLHWRIAGAKAVESFDVEVKINPYNPQGQESWTGNIEIMRIKNAQVGFILQMTVNGGIEAYWEYESGAFTSAAFTVPSIPKNVWTTIGFRSAAVGGDQVAFLVNGVDVGHTKFASWSDTALDVGLGTYAIGQTISKEIRFDDLHVTVKRKQ